MFNCCLLLLLLLKIADGQEDEYYINVEAKCPESILNPPAVITVTADLPSSKPFAVCANGEFLFTMDNFGSYSLPVVFVTNATLTCAFYQKSLAADVYSVSVYIPLSERVITIDIPEKMSRVFMTQSATKKRVCSSLRKVRSQLNRLNSIWRKPVNLQ